MKMRKILSIVAVIAISGFLFGTVNAQTVKYKQVMYVDKNTGTEYGGSNDVRYITFTNNYSSFQFTNANGQAINETGNVYSGSWSYCNQYFSVQNFGSGTFIATPTGRHYNPRIFKYQGMKNGTKVYMCRRTVCNLHNNRLIGYINDYIYFSEDMSRFNIYSGGDERSNGIYNQDARSIDIGFGGKYVYVYEKAESNSNPILY